MYTRTVHYSRWYNVTCASGTVYVGGLELEVSEVLTLDSEKEVFNGSESRRQYRCLLSGSVLNRFSKVP